MSDLKIYDDYNTLPEQVQINKDNIKTNTADITKLKDDISKIKPNAWEERKFNFLDVGEESGLIKFTTYNPITDTNTPVNIQKSFTDKDTYSITEPVNSYSFFTSGSLNDINMSIYAVCTTPSNALIDLLNLDDQKESQPSIILITTKTETNETESSLDINCTNIKANITKTRYLNMGTPGNMTSIDTIANDDVDLPNSLLTGAAISQYYLKKDDASNTYATKNELSNANKRIDALDTGTFDVDLTTSGLAKIKANVSIGTPITLTENTDFSQHLDYTNYKTVIFTLYMNDDEEYFISKDIKLNVGDTATVYGENDQNYTWLTGIGVIKLGPNFNGNNYLCYISYSQGYTSPLVITPIQKLA